MCEETSKRRNYFTYPHPYLGKYNIDIKKDNSNNYVIDLIGDEYKEWSSSKPVFLHAGTGKGKNTFVLEKLVKEARKNKTNVLYLVNRVALNTQQQKIIIDRIIKDKNERKKVFWGSNYNNYLRFDNVLVMSYQSALGILRELNSSFRTFNEIKNIEYIIFDECDFFVSDADFNGSVGFIFDQLTAFFAENCTNSKRIYMSATMDSVFPILYEKEKSLFENKFGKIASFNPLYYYFLQNYDNYNFFIFDDWILMNELIDEQEDQKFLCFVKSSKDGKDFADFLNKIWEGTNRRANFINRNNRDDNVAYEQIIDTETFEESVVFTTMLLDRGINISTKGDDRVTNIVVDSFFDEAEIKQMIGRLRVSDKKINVYLKSTNQNDLEIQKKWIRRKLKHMELFGELEQLYEQIDFLRTYDIPFYCTEDRQILIHNHNKEVLKQKLRLIELYEKAVVDNDAKQYFPYSIERFIGHYSEPPKIKPVVEEIENSDAFIIKKYLYDDLTNFNSYNQILLSWFDKAKVKELSLFKEDKEKWEGVFDNISIVRHSQGNEIKKEDYYLPYFNKGYCGFAKDHNLELLVNELKNKELIEQDMSFRNNSDVFGFLEKAIKKYNFKYKIERDTTSIEGVTGYDAEGKPKRKQLMFISQIEHNN